LREIYKAIEEVDYRGAMVMEPFLMPGGDGGRDIAVHRDLQNGIDLDKEAEKSIRVCQKQNANHIVHKKRKP
jgi:D-psicose/D-tagatose/L-ribulose 3-epimerase